MTCSDTNICFFVDKINFKFPGYSIILDNLLKHIPNSEFVSDVVDIKESRIVIPLGVTATNKLIKSGVFFKISFLTDSPTLTFKSIIEFSLKNKIFNTELIRTFLRLVKYSIIEKKIVSFSEKIIVVSDYDKDYLNKKYKCQKVLSIPNGIDIPNQPPHKKNNFFKPTIGFLYFWGVQNSIDDIDWFISSYLPILKKEFPNIEIIAAGKGANLNALNYFEKNNINYLGEVKDLNEFFSRIDFYLTTVRKKCGILNKVLESFAHQKIVIAYEGNMLAFRDLEKGFFTYKTVDELILNIRKIKSNTNEVETYVKNSLNYINEKHNWKINYNYFYSIIKQNYSN
jgi:hypothetical protein